MMQADASLDARGLSCPLPILRTKEKLRTMTAGQVLEIRCTDPEARTQIPDFVAQAGHELLAQEQDASGIDHYFVSIK